MKHSVSWRISLLDFTLLEGLKILEWLKRWKRKMPSLIEILDGQQLRYNDGMSIQQMEWAIKAFPQSTLSIDIAMAIINMFFVIAYICGWMQEDGTVKDFLLLAAPIWLGVFLILWFGAFRQKKVYVFRVNQIGGEVDFWLDFPKSSQAFFVGFAVCLLSCFFLVVVLVPGLLWLSAGPAGFGVMAAVKLMSWENTVRHGKTEWSRYDLVFIDRKRKMIVTSYKNNMLAGFEMHLEKSKIDECVSFLKTVMPDAEFRETEWKW